MNHDDNSQLTRASIFARLSSSTVPEREQAWAEFRARYAPIIAGFAAKCGASRQDIDDIIQDVLTNFFSASGEFIYDSTKGRFRGYLKTCTVRAAIRRAGKNARFRGVPLDEIPQAELAVEPIWNDEWEQQLVSQALRIVREQCQNSVAFRAFEQYVLLDRSAEIVAKELETSVNNVHQAKTRITQQLRDTVQRIRESEED
ncbi:MAG: sigma-70 family RNA polymerase sigma factor [Planctomycetia bacterium]|nr:sigma-70 family RNA polymerase sigma factor [Planctomycetia bacterium]